MDMEDYVAIKTLKKRNPQIGSRKIAELFGVSRNTVRKALRSEMLPEYDRSPKVNVHVEPFMDYIYEQLIVKNLLGSRVLKDMISKGYKGSSSAFYRYIAKIKKPVQRTFKPYETLPGEQSQFDWSTYTVIISGDLVRIYVFCFILGYSRYRVYEVSLSQTGSSTYEAMEDSIRQIGGITQRVQTDNAGCFVLECSRDGVEWNPRYLNLCGHYAFKPSHSLPRHPWSKGKVESPFYYLENHFIKDNNFSDFNDLKAKLKQFQDEVNNRIHDTTQQPPIVLFENEKSFLTALPDTRFVDIKEQVRKVTSDCLISFDGNRYSVPHQFACREVWIRVSKGCILEIYSSKNLLIASHNISTHKKAVIIEDSHYVNHKIERGNWKRLSETFLRLFPSYDWFLDKLKTQKRINPSYHLTQIIDIAKFYSVDDLIYSFNVCNNYNVFSYSFIKGVLENNKSASVDVSRLSGYLSPLSNTKNIKRPLSEYNDFLNNSVLNLPVENIL
jgi:transposase